VDRALARARVCREGDARGLLGVEDDVAAEERHEFVVRLRRIFRRGKIGGFARFFGAALHFQRAPVNDGDAVAAFLDAAAEFLNLAEGEEIRRGVTRHGQHEKVHAAVTAVRGEVLRRVEVRAPGLPPRAVPLLHQVENPFGDPVIGDVCHIGSWSAQPKWPHASTTQYASRGSDFRRKTVYLLKDLSIGNPIGLERATRMA